MEETMAYFDHTHPAAPGTLRRIAAALCAIYTSRHDAVLNRRALSKLTDAELDDIGLVRADLDLTAGGPKRRD
jgi:uncharacterized protein YjiS (DUF1127 family)